MKTYVIAAMHGDEVFGLKVLGALQSYNNPNIRMRVGHPEAVAKHTRYLESDLNRSFSTSKITKEAQIAHAIQTEIDEYQPDCILDIHTSVSNVKAVAIVARLSEEILQLATATGVDSIVLMPPDITTHSLIGCYPQNAISLEFGRYQRSDKLAVTLARNINDLQSGSSKETSQPAIYKVVGTISKRDPALKDIKNLEYNTGLKGYPFLAGENTYPTIGGFLAVKDN